MYSQKVSLRDSENWVDGRFSWPTKWCRQHHHRELNKWRHCHPMQRAAVVASDGRLRTMQHARIMHAISSNALWVKLNQILENVRYPWRPCPGSIPGAGDLFRYVTNQPTKVNSAFHPSGVGKWVPASAGKANAGMVHSISGWTRSVQVKLWDPVRTCAIPERLRGVFTTRHYTNLCLPYLTLTLYPSYFNSLFSFVHSARFNPTVFVPKFISPQLWPPICQIWIQWITWCRNIAREYVPNTHH